MTVREVRHIFWENPRVFQLSVTDSDAPEIAGGLHKAHIDINFKGNANTEALSEKMKQVPGVDITQGYAGPMFFVSVDPRYNGFDVAKQLGQVLLDEGYIGQDEITALYREIDNGRSQRAGKGHTHERF